MTVSHSFKTLFAVPMTCEACVKDVSDAIRGLGAISSVDASLADQLVTVEGSAPPSKIVEAIQATGRDAILRGSGSPNSAAVSILETYHLLDSSGKDEQDSNADASPAGGGATTSTDREVRGLARMVQVSGDVTLVDLTIRGVAPGRYVATVRELGDLNAGAVSTGQVWRGTAGMKSEQTEAAAAAAAEGRRRAGLLGVLDVGADGAGGLFVDAGFQVWEIIGRGVVVTKMRGGEEIGESDLGRVASNDEDTLAGVVARSAGVWGNDKTVCSCTGKTLWEEREDNLKRGML